MHSGDTGSAARALVLSVLTGILFVGPGGCAIDEDASVDAVGRVSLSANANGDGLSLEIENAVHFIEVIRCGGSCGEEVVNEDHHFVPLDEPQDLPIVWDTGVGSSAFTGPEWRGDAQISGSVTFGTLPKGAGYSRLQEELVVGERYVINVTRFGPCDDSNPICWHQDAVGGAFFTYEPGLSLSFDLVETPYQED